MKMYFTLAAKVLDNERLLAIYKSAKEGGISLTADDYHQYLRGFSKQPEIFNHVAQEVWQDMADDGIEPRIGHFKELLKAASVQGNVPAAMEAFRALEDRYYHMRIQPIIDQPLLGHSI